MIFPRDNTQWKAFRILFSKKQTVRHDACGCPHTEENFYVRTYIIGAVRYEWWLYETYDLRPVSGGTRNGSLPYSVRTTSYTHASNTGCTMSS